MSASCFNTSVFPRSTSSRCACSRQKRFSLPSAASSDCRIVRVELRINRRFESVGDDPINSPVRLVAQRRDIRRACAGLESRAASDCAAPRAYTNRAPTPRRRARLARRSARSRRRCWPADCSRRGPRSRSLAARASRDAPNGPSARKPAPPGRNSRPESRGPCISSCAGRGGVAAEISRPAARRR